MRIETEVLVLFFFVCGVQMQSPEMAQIPGLSQGYSGMDQSQGEMNIGRDILAELMAEKDSLDPNYVHCARLLDQGAK